MDRNAMNVDRGAVRTMIGILSVRRLREQILEKCLEGYAIREYAEYRHLRLPPCGYEPQPFPYHTRLETSFERLYRCVARLDAMRKPVIRDRRILYSESARIDRELDRLQYCLAGRTELLAACYPERQSQAAFLRARINHLRELCGEAEARILCAYYEAEELFERYSERRDAAEDLLTEAEAVLMKMLHERVHRAYFESRIRIICADVQSEIAAAKRLLMDRVVPAKPKIVDAVNDIGRLFVSLERQYASGEAASQVVARNILTLRDDLIRTYMLSLGEGKNV